ncbi:MAG: YARHG domain-containing protein [Vulcanimicrobiota bacterium]
MFCPYCGKQDAGQERFCAFCGSQFATPERAARRNAGSTNIWLLTLIVSVVVALCGLLPTIFGFGTKAEAPHAVPVLKAENHGPVENETRPPRPNPGSDTGQTLPSRSVTANLDGSAALKEIRAIPVNDASSRIAVFSAEGTCLWTAKDEPGSPGYFIDAHWTVADLDGDGLDQVIYSFPNRGGPPSIFATLDWDGSKMVEKRRGAYFQMADGLTTVQSAENVESRLPKSTTGAYLSTIDGPSEVRGRLKGSFQFSATASPGIVLTRSAELLPEDGGFRVTRWLGAWVNLPSKGLLLPKSLVEPLNESDLKGYSAMELTVIRNQVFAVHGRAFQDRELRQHFQQQAWYQESPTYKETDISTIQKRNATFVSHYQNRQNLTW